MINIFRKSARSSNNSIRRKQKLTKKKKIQAAITKISRLVNYVLYMKDRPKSIKFCNKWKSSSMRFNNNPELPHKPADNNRPRSLEAVSN
jgi:hypothetical protein